MPDMMRVAAQLEALHGGRAVPVAGTRRAVIKGGAYVICPISMAGEDATVHAVAFGRLGHAPEIRVVPDPR